MIPRVYTTAFWFHLKAFRSRVFITLFIFLSEMPWWINMLPVTHLSHLIVTCPQASAELSPASSP